MIQFNCLDNVDFLKNNQSFLNEKHILDIVDNFNFCNDKNYLNALDLISNQNKIIVNFNDDDIFFEYIYRFLHYLFFPIFFLNKRFDNVVFIFKKPKSLNNFYEDFFNFLFEIFDFNNIKYIILDKNVKNIYINNFIIYERPDISKPLLQTIENEHNYHLPKQLISNVKRPLSGKIIIPLLNNKFNDDQIKKYLVNFYNIDLNDVKKHNIEIVYLDKFNTFKHLLDYIKNVSYVIVIENNIFLQFLLFTHAGATFFVSSSDYDITFNNYLSKICHSMFLNNIVVTKDLSKDLICIQ